MRSSGVWMSIIPLQRFTAGKPLRMRALTSEPPPLATSSGAWPRDDEHAHRHRDLGLAVAQAVGRELAVHARLEVDLALAGRPGERVEHGGELDRQRALVEAARLGGELAALGHDVGGGAALDRPDVGGRLGVDAPERHPRDRPRGGVDGAAPGLGREARVGGAPDEGRDDLVQRRRRGHHVPDGAGVVVDEAEAALQDRRVERGRAAQPDLLARGEEQLDARVGELLVADAAHRLEHHGDGGLVVAAEDRRVAVREVPVDELDLDRPGHRHGVEVGAEDDRRAPRGRGREPPDDVPAARADRRRRAVLDHLRPQRAQLAADDLGDAALVARRRGDLAEARHRAGRRRQPGELLRGHPPRRAGSRSRPGSPAAPGARGRGADELAEQRLRPRGPALELGVELRGAEPRVLGQLDDLDQALVGRVAADDQARRPRAARAAPD